MRLRQIKLAGFKSFADLAHIELQRPLVGIVGPNGCGKSNVIDAVRWVLGEARASELRGGSMKELIFAGSSGRKPLGRASVELCLTNEDGRIKGPWGEFAELNVKRVVTSDGQSSYFINQQRVRRRDVQDLFLGTGLGPRSYAIISQGMISNFIKAKPEELRVYLEEAAGVSLYRERRKETESLLTQTRNNLERVHDMQQIKEEEASRLEGEAETARRWKALSDEKEAAEALWYWMQYDEVRQKVNVLNADIAADEAAIEECKSRILEKEDEIPVLEARLETVNREFAQATLELRTAERALTEAEAERRRREERREKASADLRDAEMARTRKTAEIHQSEDEISRHLLLEKGFLDDLELSDEEIAGLEETCDELESRTEDARAEADRCQAAASDAEARRRVAKAQSENAAKKAEDCLKRLSRLEAKTDDLSMPDESEVTALAEEAEALRAEAEDAREAMADIEEALHEARAERERTDEAYFRLLAEEKETRAKLDALEGVEKQQAQSGQLGEFEAAEGLDGLTMLIDDLTIDPEWVTAVESVMGNRVRAKVLRNLAFGAGYEKKRPPAPLFFIDGAGEPRDASESFRVGETVFAPLISKVSSHTPANRRVTEAWLHNIWCVPDLACALRYREHLPDGALLVTPSGDRVSSVSLDIWAVDNPDVSVLSRRQEIENLRERLYTLEENSGVAQTRRLSAKAEVERLEKEGRLAAERVKGLEAALMKTMAEEKALRDRRTLVEQHLADLRRSREEIEDERDEALAEAEEALDRSDEAERSSEKAKSIASRAQIDFRQLSDKLKQMTDGLNRRRREADQTRAQIRQLEQARGFLSKRIEALRADLDREAERLAAAQAVLAETDTTPVNERERAAIDGVDRAECRLRTVTDARSEAERIVQEARKKIHEWQSALMPMTEALGVKRVERQVKESLREQFSERLDELEADRGELAKKALERPVKAQSVRARVQHLVSQIAALGPVNHAALEHLESVRKILEETARQVSDLEKGIETLEGAIRKIDAETRGRMKETFEEVNSHFAATFKDLFGGGHAALSWEGDDILTAGVWVQAQPPGKKNVSVKQLSGGEQALTATALVFAIFKLNPAPFCLLDEVDAPLDEANQARLAGMCQRMSVNTQFLMITHHRVTMEYAGALIGVTMKEPGVSRVVSVDIENAVKMSA